MKPVPSTHGARGFSPRRRHLRPLEAAPPTHGARGFATRMQYLGKNAFRCHPCHLVATRNTLILKQCCKVATVARVKNFMYARVREEF